MIDFEKELASFNCWEIDKDLKEMKYETSLSLQHFSSMFKKLRKEQNDVNYHLEEVTSSMAAIKNKAELLSEMQRSLNSSEEEKLALIKCFIAVLDQFEVYYKYICKHADPNWADQFRNLWDQTAELLLARGIYRIEGENSRFDPRLYVVKSLSYHEHLPESIITEVFKCGYIYKSTVLRKAEVRVNKRNIEEACGFEYLYNYESREKENECKEQECRGEINEQK